MDRPSLALALATLALSACNPSTTIPAAPGTPVTFAPSPPPPAPPPPPLNPRTPAPPPSTSDAELLRAAVLFASCVPDDGVHRALLTRVYERDSDLVQLAFAQHDACLAARTDGCDGVAACLGVRVDRLGPCRPSCEGETFVACDDSTRFSIDCARLGLTCDLKDVCVNPAIPRAPCDNVGESACLGQLPMYCSSSGLRPGVPCDEHGLSCATIEPGSVACQGAKGACRSTTYGSLGFDYLEGGLGCVDSDTLQLCVANGVHEVRCDDLRPGLSCQQTPDGAAFCGLAAECDPTTRATCDGSALVTCLMGQRASIDCTTLGFGGCRDNTHMGATCVP